MTTTIPSPLDAFAAQYRLRIARDAYGTRIIAGRVGSLITDYGDGRLTVLLMGTGAGWWNNRRRALIAAGCQLEQDGDTEGSLSFDPANVTACALAITAAGIKRRRVATEAQLAALKAHGKPFTPLAPRGYSAGNTSTTDDREPGGLSPLPDASDVAYGSRSDRVG